MKRVYFIKPIGMDGPIKIGCSYMPLNRLRALMGWSPFPLELLATFEGDFDDERRMHSLFSACRDQGEWFHPAPDLLSLIARLQAGERIGDIVDLDAVDTTTLTAGKVPGKQSVTAQVTFAEKRAFGPFWQRPVERPDYIQSLLDDWRATRRPETLPDHRAALTAYADELRKQEPHPGYCEELRRRRGYVAAHRARKAAA